MSIINRMLKDLEQKTTTETLSPIYRPQSHRLPLWYWLVLVLFPLVLWVWWPKIQALWHPTEPVPTAQATPAVAMQPAEIKPVEAQVKVAEAPAPEPIVAPAPQVVAAPQPIEPIVVEPPAEKTIAPKTETVSKTTKDKPLSTDVTVPVTTQEPEADDDTGYDNAIVEMPTPQPEMHVQEEKLSAGEIAALERRKYQTAMVKRDTDAAKQALQTVLANDPLDIRSRKQLAALYYGENALDSARDTLTEGVRLSPTNADLRLLAARVIQTQGQTSEALQLLKAIQPSARQNLDFYALRAALAQQIGDLTEAEHTYRALTLAEPSSGRWWLGLAITQEKQGEMSGISVASYRRALLDRTLSGASRHFAEQRIQKLTEQQ